MAVIKLTKKEKLDQLLARLTLLTGNKPTQQDVLDAAVDLAEEHFEELKQKFSNQPLIDNEKINRIRLMRKRLSTIEWIKPERNDFSNENDADIYSV